MHYAVLCGPAHPAVLAPELVHHKLVVLAPGAHPAALLPLTHFLHRKFTFSIEFCFMRECHLDSAQVTGLRAPRLGQEDIVTRAERAGHKDRGVHSPDHV